MYDVIIIGAGVIGCMIARVCSRYNMSICILEKSNDVGNKTSSANSAIIHSGYDPIPNTNKAKFNVLGNKMFDQLSEELDVPFFRNGSLTVALDDEQYKMLQDLYKRSKENNVEVKILSKEETLKLEPNLNPNIKGSLLAPSAGVIDPFLLTIHACENACDNGAKLFRNKEVTSISTSNNNSNDEYSSFIVTCKDNSIYESRCIINAAGLYSDIIANMIEEVDWSITPRKGEYYLLEHFAYNYVNHTIFPLPSKKGKGILFSITSSGNFIVGPTSEVNNNKDDTSTDIDTLNYIKDSVIEMVPSIPFNKTIRTFSGNRATCSRHDFIIEYSKKYKSFINVAGIESPGLVSSPAIAEYVVKDLLLPILNKDNKDNITINPNYNPYIRKHHRLYNSIMANDFSYIKDNLDYGEVICSCERVTKGEILDEFNRSVPPMSIRGVKRRTRAGFGKCQGGFCQSKVLLLLAEHLHVSPLDINLDEDGSFILSNKIKDNK